MLTTTGFEGQSIWVRKIKVDATLAGRGNSSVMSTLDEPVLIVVGSEDTTTRPEMSAALFEQAVVGQDRKELLVVEGAGHMNAARGEPYAAAFLRLLARASPADSDTHAR